LCQYVGDEAEISGSDHSDDMQTPDRETSTDRNFLDDRSISPRSSQGGFRGPDARLFEREGSRASYNADQPKAKRTRVMPRTQAGKFEVKNQRKALFGDPQEVHLILYVKIYIWRLFTDRGVTAIQVG
jgi:hypothetical protein